MRVFIGLMEISNFAFTYSKGFRSLGHQTYSAVFTKNPYYPSSKYDVEILRESGSLWKRYMHAAVALLSVFLKALRTCDTFIFLFGTSFLPRYWDYAILKMCGKRIVSVFLGDDIRHWCPYEQEMRLLGCERELKPHIEFIKSDDMSFFGQKIRVVRAAERYADLILSDPSIDQLQTRPYMGVRPPIDLSQYRFHVPDREVPLVLHAPSSRGGKGTDRVLAAVDQLRKEGIPFEFRLIEGVSNDQLRELLTEADILVDSLYNSGDFGMLAVESMASGNVVLGRYDPQHAHIPSNCPVVNVNTETLTEQLRRAILDRDLRRELAYAGRKYVEKYDDYQKVVRQIIKWLEPGPAPPYGYVPTFFRDGFMMPPTLLKEERLRRRRQRRKLPRQVFELLYPWSR
jgi:glycosyltransferase involved in cell wall biosynthesis